MSESEIVDYSKLFEVHPISFLKENNTFNDWVLRQLEELDSSDDLFSVNILVSKTTPEGKDVFEPVKPHFLRTGLVEPVAILNFQGLNQVCTLKRLSLKRDENHLFSVTDFIEVSPL